LTNTPGWVTKYYNVDGVADDFVYSTSGPAAVAGYPDVTVPAGFAGPQEALPIGISFFGTRWDDEDLLDLAYSFEQATQARRAPATQRARRIELGTAVIPLGWENPLRLAEDLATVDVLSGGRLNPGVSVGPPMHWDDVRDALYPDTADVEDFSHERVARLLRF